MVGLSRRRVRVHLKSGPTLEGILLKRWPMYVLMVPKLLEDEESTLSMDGPVEIPRDNVHFYEVLT